MAESRQYLFKFKELAELMIKSQNIHDGFWGIYVEFGIQGTNLNISPDQENLVPTAIIPVLHIGLQRFDQPNSLTVDASAVNPAK